MPQAAQKSKPERLTEEEVFQRLSQGSAGTRRLTEDEVIQRLSQASGAPEKPSLIGAATGSFLEALSAPLGAAGIGNEQIGQFLQKAPAGTQARSIGQLFGGSVAPLKAGEEALQSGAQAVYPEETRGQGGLPEQLAGGVGGIAGSIPAMLAGPAAAAVQFGAMTGVPLYYEVLGKTNNKEAATLALLLGGAVGQLERLPGIEKALGGTLTKLASGKIAGALEKATLAVALRTSLSETAQEVAQQGLTDAIQEELTGEDLANIERMKAVIPPSLILGGGFGLLLGAINRAGPQTLQEAPGAPPAPEAAQESFTDEPPPGAPPGRAVADIGEETAPGATQSTPALATPPEPSAQPEAAAPEAPAPLPTQAEAETAQTPETVESASYQEPTPDELELSDAALDKIGGMAEDLLSGSAILTTKETGQVRQAWGLLRRAIGSYGSMRAYLEEAPPHSKEDLADAMRIIKDTHERRVVRSEIPEEDEFDAELDEDAAEAEFEERAPKQLAAAKKPEQSTISVKNAAVERDLKEMGLPAPKKAERGSQAKWHAEALERFKKDNTAGQKLVKELKDDPRAPDPVEDLLITFELNRLKKERVAAEEAFLKDPSDANQKRIDRAKADFAEASDVASAAGTASSYSLSARKAMVAEDYSLAAMERSMQVAKGAEPLTAKETAKVKELQKELEITRLAHEKYVTESELKKAEQAAELAILRMRKDLGKGQKRVARKKAIEQTKKEIDEILNRLGSNRNKAATGLGGLDAATLADVALLASKTLKLGAQTFVQFSDYVVSKLGEGIRPYLKPAWEQAHGERRKELAHPIKEKLQAGEPLEAAQSHIQKLAESFVEQGVHEREKLVDAVHEVVKDADPNISREDVRDAISGYGRFRKLSKIETKRKLRELKGEMRELAKLEALVAGQKPKQTGFERRKPTQQELKLNDKTRQLMKDLGFTKKPGPRWNVGTANEAAVEAKRLASKIKARKTRLTNQIADLNERIASKNFGPALKKVTPLDEGAIKLKAEHEAVRRRYEREKTRFELANRTRTKKILDGVREVLIDLPRAIKSAYDVSAPFRQGVIFTVGHPIKSVKNVGRMFRALASERKALEIDVELRSRPLYEFGERSKLTLTRLDDDVARPGEEAIQSKWSQKIPGIKASNRAFVTYLNLQRAQMFDLMVRAMPKDPTLEDGKAIANFVNIATGRGNFGRFAGSAEGASLILWSPRLLLSRIQFIAGQPLYKGTFQTRKLIAKEYARFLMGMAAAYTLARMAQDAYGDDEISVDEDWRSSDFGKIKIGNTRIDPLGGLAQVLTLTGRTISGETKTGKGEVRSLVDPKFGQDDLTDVYKRFARSKLTPFLGAVTDLRTGENIVGEKVTPGTAARDFAAPLSFGDIKKAMEEQGVPAGAAMGILAMFGMGLQTYDANRKREK